jgi:hypothetical protein
MFSLDGGIAGTKSISNLNSMNNIMPKGSLTKANPLNNSYKI